MPRLDAMSYAEIDRASARWYERKGWAAENADDPDDLIADPDTDDGDTYDWPDA